MDENLLEIPDYASLIKAAIQNNWNKNVLNGQIEFVLRVAMAMGSNYKGDTNQIIKTLKDALLEAHTLKGEGYEEEREIYIAKNGIKGNKDAIDAEAAKTGTNVMSGWLEKLLDNLEDDSCQISNIMRPFLDEIYGVDN